MLDTNIFLEILLSQGKSDICKSFITSHHDEIVISDFSLHSIGVVLYRYKKYEAFYEFIRDVVSRIRILNLPSAEYVNSFNSKKEYDLDFDDYYQCIIAKYYNLQIVTMAQILKKSKISE